MTLMIEMFEFIRDYKGEVPGASPKDCGNYLDMNLPMARYLARKFCDEVLEDIHSEVYQVAEQALEEGKDLPPDERIANVLLTACSRLSEIGAMKFIEEDSAYLLRRIPAQVKAEHYHSDEVHIRDLLEESGLTPRGGIALAAATIRGLILTVSHQEQIGALYPQVLETLTRGACEELFPRA